MSQMKRVMDDLIGIAETVKVGTRYRGVCPLCHGGKSKEESLTVDRMAGYARCRCWRASCTLGGVRVNLDGSIYASPMASHTKTKPVSVGWDGPTVPAPPDVVPYATVPLRLTEDNRLVIPMLDRRGVRWGDIVRQLKPYTSDMPKSLSLYDHDAYDGMAWFMPKSTDSCDLSTSPVVVVEDALSAMRLASAGCIGIALVGVHITPERAYALSKLKGRHINLVLDADAYRSVAIRHAIHYASLITFVVHRIFHDVKDMDDEEFGNFMGTLVV